MLVLSLSLGLAAAQGGAAAPAAGGAQGGDNKNPPKEPIECKVEALNSYMLKGRHKAKETPVYTCPTIKQSCCTKTDQQKMYHIVNDIVPSRTLEYGSKMKLALARLKALHQRILTNQPTFTGSSKRREFCNQQARKVYNFPFNFFYNEVLEEMEMIRSEMDEYYKKFFCVLCDATNHEFLNIKAKTPNIMMRGEFCKEILKQNQDIIKLFNVELVEYLVSLQHLVDCTHYIKSYNLKFFDEKKQNLMPQVSECLNNIEGNNFLKYCQSTCEQLKISKIVEIIEGDFEFLIDAVNLFEKFFELKESGNLVSMKLRTFFKKFVIPRKLGQNQTTLFLNQVKKDVEVANAKKPPRELTDDEKYRKPEPEAEVKMSQRGRLLAEAAGGASNSTNGSANGSNGTNGTNSSNVTQKRTAKLVFNKDLFHFYDEITIMGPEKGQLIFRIREPPTDLDLLPKTFGVGTGINPLDYNTKFSMAQDVFYKLIFSYRKPDVIDTNLMFFLVDFNSKNYDLLKSDLTADFKIPVETEEEEGGSSGGDKGGKAGKAKGGAAKQTSGGSSGGAAAKKKHRILAEPEIRLTGSLFKSNSKVPL